MHLSKIIIIVITILIFLTCYNTIDSRLSFKTSLTNSAYLWTWWPVTDPAYPACILKLSTALKPQSSWVLSSWKQTATGTPWPKRSLIPKWIILSGHLLSSSASLLVGWYLNILTLPPTGFQRSGKLSLSVRLFVFEIECGGGRDRLRSKRSSSCPSKRSLTRETTLCFIRKLFGGFFRFQEF